MPTSVDLLIVGAGPFGLAVAAQAAALGLDHLVVGEPMGFWREHMPEGMLLRSGADWHLDPLGVFTVEAFLAERGQTNDEVSPLTRAFYLDYVRWFADRRGIEPLPVRVERLDAADGPDGRFAATLDDGRVLAARRVVLALGMGFFAHVPPELAALVPPGRAAHTHDAVDFAPLAGRRVLILGGRQSAFEWAALVREAGAAAVEVVHRHASPAFAEADWTWVSPLVDGMVTDPAWFRALPPEEQRAVSLRLWGEGRLKVEPWLESRVNRDGITVRPHTELVACRELPSGELAATLRGPDGSIELTLDRVLFATGYKVDLGRVPLLARGDLLPRIAVRDGYPLLDEGFQTSVPGLFVTSMAAGGAFGPFFGFTVSARASARIIGAALAAAPAAPAAVA